MVLIHKNRCTDGGKSTLSPLILLFALHVPWSTLLLVCILWRAEHGSVDEQLPSMLRDHSTGHPHPALLSCSSLKCSSCCSAAISRQRTIHNTSSWNHRIANGEFLNAGLLALGWLWQKIPYDLITVRVVSTFIENTVTGPLAAWWRLSKQRLNYT